MAQVADLDGRRTGVSGSLASTQLPAAVSSAVYNADNQLTQWGSTAMTYDADGNTLNDGTNTYTWDARNHLVSADNNGATFVYDGFGRRYGKTMLGANTNFLYDGLNPVQELNGTTPTANLLTGGLDERFTRTDATGTFSYLTDALGSTIGLTDSTGNSDVQYSYGPYGSMSITGTSTNSYAYTGREFDGLGIDYYRARYYNPTTGRFISEDPAEFSAGDVNLYRYVGNDPHDFTDPFGLDRHNVCNGTPVTAISGTYTWGLGELGAAVGGGLGEVPGALIGYAIGSEFGVGINLTYIPSTQQWYLGPAASFTPLTLGGGTGGSITAYSFPSQQAAGSVLSRWSGSVTFQPEPFMGVTMTKSPGSPAVPGYTIGSRLPVAFSGSYGWLVWKGKC